MDGGEGLRREVGEESVALVFADEIGEFIVAAVDLVGADEAPFADVYPLVGLVHAPVGKGVAVDDVFGQDVADRLDASFLALRLVEALILIRETTEKPLPAGGGIVREEFDAINAGHGPDGIVLVLELGVLLCLDAGFAEGELAPENLNQEVAVTASRLQETGVNPLRLRLDQVEHRVHFAWVGKHLAVSRHPFSGLDLGVHSALS